MNPFPPCGGVGSPPNTSAVGGGQAPHQPCLNPDPYTPHRTGEGPRLVGRRVLMVGGALAISTPAFAAPSAFAAIEARAKGRLGVAALDVATGRRLVYRADERFAMCSTFKTLLVAFVLAKVDAGDERLDRRVGYTAADLLDYAPTARAHLADGAMRVEALCIAAVELSDNTAANLLLRETGGPTALTAWLRKIGDPLTRLDNTEPQLNVWTPGETHDTTTPNVIVATWRKILLGEVLSAPSRARLTDWLKGTKTGLARLRAGVPNGWTVGDKTGTWSGPPAIANDIAILWPPQSSSSAPILAAAFLSQSVASEDQRNAALADAGRVIARAFARV